MSSAIAHVVITGASSGIGLDAARRFLRAGSSLIINGSNAEKLERAARSLEGGERVLASMSGGHPLGRIGEVRDTSDAVFYLATADFVTGTVLDVDGGYSHAR